MMYCTVLLMNTTLYILAESNQEGTIVSQVNKEYVYVVMLKTRNTFCSTAAYMKIREVERKDYTSQGVHSQEST